MEEGRDICDRIICRENKGHFFGFCDNINDLISYAGRENIEIEEEEENTGNDNQDDDEVEIIRKTGSFKGEKYASVNRYDDFSNNIIEDIPPSVNCFCCTQVA